MKKKLLKYGPMLYAIWTNPGARAKVISALESVNNTVQRLANRRTNPATATLVHGERVTTPSAGKVESLVQRIPATLFTTAAKGVNGLTEFLAKQDSKARSSVK